MDTEPAFVGVGVEHVAVGMNNTATFYSVTRAGGGERTRQMEYIGTVQRVHMNATHAAALMDGRVQLHLVD